MQKKLQIRVWNVESVLLILERLIKKESFFLMTTKKKGSQTSPAIHKIGACKSIL